MLKTILSVLLILFPASAWATSDAFPPSETRPVVADFLPSPSNTYYCSPTGDNDTGTGTIGNPWLDLAGADGTVAAGDLIYFRGGAYPDYAYQSGQSPSRSTASVSRTSANGTAQNPIVITNYPGETVTYNSTENSFCMTLYGDYQKLIGTMVGSAYGIQITGGVSVHGDNCQVSNVEFIEGCSNHDANPAMVSVPTNNGCDALLISHNLFRDSDEDTFDNRMSCVRFFTSTNAVVEYNTFEDNLELSVGGAVYFKESVTSGTVRYNTFLNNRYDVVAVGQQQTSDTLAVHHNLSYGSEFFFEFFVEWGDDFDIYQNVVLNIDVGGAFYLYHNNGSNTYTDKGDFYDNIIDGHGFEDTDSGASNNNLPSLFDYNLWYDVSDQNCSSFWTCPSTYHDNDVISDGAVTYSAVTHTATVADDYAGLGQGRTGGNIGGFTFEGAGGGTSGSSFGQGVSSATGGVTLR